MSIHLHFSLIVPHMLLQRFPTTVDIHQSSLDALWFSIDHLWWWFLSSRDYLCGSVVKHLLSLQKGSLLSIELILLFQMDLVYLKRLNISLYVGLLRCWPLKIVLASQIYRDMQLFLVQINYWSIFSSFMYIYNPSLCVFYQYELPVSAPIQIQESKLISKLWKLILKYFSLQKCSGSIFKKIKLNSVL